MFEAKKIKKAKGFSIIELLIVMAIVGGIVTGIVVYVTSSSTAIKISQAEAQILQIGQRVKVYGMSKGYPTTEEGLEVLNRPGAPKDEKMTFLDPWGNKLNYVYPAVRNPGGYDLFSNGPDGIPNTEDDIGNW